ncbi:MAG: ATP-binding cassette, subfamily bacterial [Solirubrobacteraceae bacterium]|nr:ATP-binding cassette, subfamily bacterial [Solirubrobacteraceae bacterium]
MAAAPQVSIPELLRRFWPFARPYRARIALGLLPLVAIPAVEAVEIWLFGVVVDEVLVPRDVGMLLPIALAYVGLALLGAIIGFADDVLATWVGERFLLDLRTHLLAHVQRLAPHTLDRRRLGDTLSRITGDVAAIESFLLAGIANGVSAVVRIGLFGGMLFVIAWQLALLALVVAPVAFFSARHFSRLIKQASREKRRRAGSLSAVTEEGLANVALVQSLNREAAELERFRHEAQRIMDAELAITRIRAVFAPITDLIQLLGAMAVLAGGVWLLSRGTLTLGELLVFVTFLGRLYSPMRQLSSLSTAMFSAAAGAERVLELLRERPAVSDRAASCPLPRADGLLELRGVSYRYPGATADALHDVSLAARPGETLVVVGPSGAGKSTLARLLVRFDDPSSGAVLLDGNDLRDLTLRSVREHIGVLAQETLLPDLTVAEVIAQGREDATAEQVRDAARAAGAHEFIEALPDGYDTRVGQRGRLLSGGQRQRVAIARALVRDPAVLVLDEPTTGLDAEAKEALREPLRRLAAGRTTIVITHDADVMLWADRVVELRQGSVVEAVAA